MAEDSISSTRLWKIAKYFTENLNCGLIQSSTENCKISRF